MNRNRLTELSCLLLLFFSQATFALSTDKFQDIEIEADSAKQDDIKGVAIYRGNVIVVQGSIRMTGDKMTVYFDDNGDMELVIMIGRPATYRQLPDDSKIYDEAEALQMEYYVFKDYIILIDEALVTQESLRFSGNRIEYDTVLSRVDAKGKTSKSLDTPDSKKDDSRVKITIKKKKPLESP